MSISFFFCCLFIRLLFLSIYFIVFLSPPNGIISPKYSSLSEWISSPNFFSFFRACMFFFCCSVFVCLYFADQFSKFILVSAILMWFLKSDFVSHSVTNKQRIDDKKALLALLLYVDRCNTHFFCFANQAKILFKAKKKSRKNSSKWKDICKKKGAKATKKNLHFYLSCGFDTFFFALQKPDFLLLSYCCDYKGDNDDNEHPNALY